MIYDHISKAPDYFKTHPRFEQAFAFLMRPDLDTLPLGKLELDGDNLFAIIQTYDTKDPLPRAIERHRTYIDIQFILHGIEKIGISPPHTLKPSIPYDEAKDIEWFTGDALELPLAQRHFLVLFPHEAHQPGLHFATCPSPVKKIVVKVRY